MCQTTVTITPNHGALFRPEKRAFTAPNVSPIAAAVTQPLECVAIRNGEAIQRITTVEITRNANRPIFMVSHPPSMKLGGEILTPINHDYRVVEKP